jgi:hypothetical protein
LSTTATKRPNLAISVNPCEGAPGGVRVGPLNADLAAFLANPKQAVGLLASVLRVKVVESDVSGDEELPDVLGRYHVSEAGLQFVPLFPFERGIEYRASFDTGQFDHPDFGDALTLTFLLPKEPSTRPAEVTNIFPSSDMLPENLLRFYVCFSHPMQRGRAQAEILILGPDGQPSPDVLYRAPVELWDRSMRQLTILLDPGRLKRGVGPNRELGPPLKDGQTYTLAVGQGMTDIFGNQLSNPVYKRFDVNEAIRDPILVEQWKLVLPLAESRQPLTLTFPRPLDWALFPHAIVVESACGQPINGQVEISHTETRWAFVPTVPWNKSSYRVRVASDLEDLCGNSLIAPFDRGLRAADDFAHERAPRLIPFYLT